MNTQHSAAGQTALVTGASRGIGKAIALALARTGRFVFLNFASNTTKAEKVLERIKEEGGNGELLPFDVTDQAAAQSAVKRILKERDRLMF